jgi:hypothetical protein
MAYAAKNLRRLTGSYGVPSIWSYSSTDAVATVRAANYVTNARQLGMRVGDIVIVTVTSSGVPTAVSLCVVMAVAAAGADLADGTSISVTNT